MTARGPAASNPEWNEALNLINLCVNGEMVARSALVRTESRGAHYRQDYPAARSALGCAISTSNRAAAKCASASSRCNLRV